MESFWVEMHFKEKIVVVFQIVFDEFQIRAKGEVNNAQNMKNAYQNINIWYCKICQNGF